MRILQISTSDMGGGAEKVAWNLFQAYRKRGHDAWLAVGWKRTDHPHVLLIRNRERRGTWSRFWWAVHDRFQPPAGRMRGAYRLSRWARRLAEPKRSLDRYSGVEDFHFPGTSRLLSMTRQPPDIVHCHNLHGAYFDLRVLPWLSHEIPVVLTLHDAWLLSGHCAHSFDCERWKTGCGHCPDLTIYPAIRRDATADNWRRKRAIYAESRLYVATPSRWLMSMVEWSMLAPALVEARVIPNGVDQAVFHPGERRAARRTLGIPQDAWMLLFTARGIHRNPWKDYQTMRGAVAVVAERLDRRTVIFIALGEDAPTERVGQAEVRFVPYVEDPEAVARYYHAADLYLQASHVETFPNTVLEALACGTPVVATAVGGIPEQVKGLQIADLALPGAHLNRYSPDEATGVLVLPGDSEAMAVGIQRLLNHESLRRDLGVNAARDARSRFSLKRQVNAYLAWYQELAKQPSQRQDSLAQILSTAEKLQ